jgi:hypothetical protein
MGPKEVFGEYVDGKLASRAAKAQPDAYDGVVLPSPGVDSNYDVTSYRHLREIARDLADGAPSQGRTRAGKRRCLPH